ASTRAPPTCASTTTRRCPVPPPSGRTATCAERRRSPSSYRPGASACKLCVGTCTRCGRWLRGSLLRREVLLLVEPGDQLLVRQRPADQVALRGGAAKVGQLLVDVRVLAALGHRGEAEVVGEVERRADDRLAVRVPRRHRGDERLVDLQRADRQAL